MDPSRYAAFLPTILDWLNRTLDSYSVQKRSVASFEFLRLPRYLSSELLKTTSVVITDPLPVPPLTAVGLSEFAAFEKHLMSGITYLNTYFLLAQDATAKTNRGIHMLFMVVEHFKKGAIERIGRIDPASSRWFQIMEASLLHTEDRTAPSAQ